MHYQNLLRKWKKLNKHLIELCEYVHQSGMNPHFISNGLLLGRLDLERLMSLVDDFGISLDSIDNNVLNKLWGVDQINLKERIIENLDKIEDICGKLSKTVRIKIMPIVSKMNAEKIGEIVELLKNRYKNIVFRWSMTKYGKIGNSVE